MAVATYIQQAAHEIRNAIGALHSEISSIQHESLAQETRLKNDADKAENEAGLLRLRAASATEIGREVGYEARRAALEIEARQKRQAADKQSADVAQLVQAKTSLLNNLESAASQLDRMASSSSAN